MTHYDDAKESFRCEHGRVRGFGKCSVCEPPLTNAQVARTFNERSDPRAMLAFIRLIVPTLESASSPPRGFTPVDEGKATGSATECPSCLSERRLRAQAEQLIADWRERARVVRPLEAGPISAEKRERVKEWMFYTNRANELAAILALPAAPSVALPHAHETTKDDDVTRSVRLDAEPPPQHAAMDTKG